MIKLSNPRIYESLLFIALLSGPPRLRIRDAYASLRGEIDWSVLISIIIWGLGAFWIFSKFAGHVVRKKQVKLELMQRISIVFVCFLSLSILVSSAVFLTTYRISQIIIMILFCFLWIKSFGVESSIKHLFIGYLILNISIGIATIIAPDLVFIGGNRLRGDLVANTGAVAAMGLVLLLGYPIMRKRIMYFLLLVIFVTLLLMSRTRSAYAAVFLFAFLAAVRSLKENPIRCLSRLFLLSIPIIIAFKWVPTVLEWLIRERGSIASLSLRIPLWRHVLSITFTHSPWVGLGFYATRPIMMSYNPDLGTAHSAFIEVLSGGGILSFLVFIIICTMLIFWLIKLLFMYTKDSTVFVVAGLFFTSIFIGLVSEEMVIASPTAFTFWMLVSLIPVIARNRQASAR